MSFLQLLAGIPSFNKSVISFWFRVPQASMDKASVIFGSNSNPLSLNNGIIPLVVMGKHGTGQLPYQRKYQSTNSSTWDQLLYYTITANYIAGDYNVNGQNLDCSWQPLPFTTLEYGANNPFVATGPVPQADPTYIGVDGSGNLHVYFQTAQAPEVVGWDWYLASLTPGSEVNAVSDYGGPFFSDGPQQGSGGSGPNDPFIYYSEQYYFWRGGTGSGTKVYAPGGHNIILPVEHYVDIDGVPTGVITNDGYQRITADQWHHVLISVDLQTIASRGAKDQNENINVPEINFVSGTSKFYIAVDDVNYTQYNLSSEWVFGGSDNDVITNEAAIIAGKRITTDGRGNPLPMASYTLADPNVPASGQVMGVPATAEFVNSVFNVEMAELQIFVGIAIDAGIEANRRAFIGPKSENSLPPSGPNPPSVGTVNGNLYPIDPKVAQNLLGKKPEVIFHGSSNWIKGKNTGSLGIDKDGKPIASGQFKPTGTIKRYKPDPSINPSAPSPAGAAKKIPEGVG